MGSLERLSQPRPLPSGFQHNYYDFFNRKIDVDSIPKASERISSLSRPKSRLDNPIFSASPYWSVPDKTKKHEASERTLTLSRSKSVHSGYMYPRSTIWDCSEIGKHPYTTPDRLVQLSTPISREDMKNDRQNPFAVPRAALTAQTTPRILELSTPRAR